MKHRILILAALLLMVACARHPVLPPLTDQAQLEAGTACSRIFPAGHWQFVHAIEATLAGNRKSVLTGVSTVSSDNRSARCVLLTVEGLVLFDAEYDGTVRVHRAIPPFDGDAFARGLLEDIRLIFFPPEGAATAGLLESGKRVCRYRTPDNRTVDVVLLEEGTWEIHRYGADTRLERSVRSLDIQLETGFPGRMVLTAQGEESYRLVLRLIDAAALSKRTLNTPNHLQRYRANR